MKKLTITLLASVALAAASYGAKPDANDTSPTGFDPRAVILFEAIVEAAYLVASADGLFDDTERETFSRIVAAACGGVVPPRRLAKLIHDFSDMLLEDGLEKRIAQIAANSGKREHQEEVLRIGVLIADASGGGIGHAERQVLERLAMAFQFSSGDIDRTIDIIRRELGTVR